MRSAHETIALGGPRSLQAYGRWVRAVLRGAGVAGATLAGLTVIALLGVLAAVAGGIILAAESLGVGAALIIGGAVALGLAAAGVVATRAWHRRAVSDARERLRADMRVHLAETESPVWASVIRTLARNPDVVAGAAFATITLAGPRGAIRLVLRGARLVGCSAIATKVIRELGRRDGEG